MTPFTVGVPIAMQRALSGKFSLRNPDNNEPLSAVRSIFVTLGDIYEENYLLYAAFDSQSVCPVGRLNGETL